MTLNERLYVGGLIDVFDQALERKDKKIIISILNDVGVKESSVAFVLKELGFSSEADEEE